jgi:hypothetical protein
MLPIASHVAGASDGAAKSPGAQAQELAQEEQAASAGSRLSDQLADLPGLHRMRAIGSPHRFHCLSMAC